MPPGPERSEHREARFAVRLGLALGAHFFLSLRSTAAEPWGVQAAVQAAVHAAAHVDVQAVVQVPSRTSNPSHVRTYAARPCCYQPVAATRRRREQFRDPHHTTPRRAPSPAVPAQRGDTRRDSPGTDRIAPLLPGVDGRGQPWRNHRQVIKGIHRINHNPQLPWSFLAHTGLTINPAHPPDLRKDQ